jgi:phosphate transport system ATP-binding protein
MSTWGHIDINPVPPEGDAVPNRIRIRTEPLPTVVRPRNGRQLEAVRPAVFDIRDMSAYYGKNRALTATTLKIYRHVVTAVIGPSGCGKSTFIRSLNRMNDSIPGFRLSGKVLYHGHDIYEAGVNRVEVRRRIGMVFQKPNPFPKSVYDNVAWAPRNLGLREDLDSRVERAETGRALGRGEGSPEKERAQPVRWSATASLHRPRDRGRA